MPSRMSSEFEADGEPVPHTEAGCASSGSSRASTPEIYFTTPHLTFLNRQLQNLEPQRNPSLQACLLECLLTCSWRRNSSMVHNHAAFAIPDNFLRSHWLGHH